MVFDNSFVSIDLDALEGNLAAVRAKTGKKIMAIVKADAYGHGAVQVARALEGKCEFFGVSSAAEALELRYAGISTPILILGHTPANACQALVRHEIRPTIFRMEDALELSRAATTLGVTARFHLAVDTGMSRIGFAPTEESIEVCLRLAALPGLEVEGIFSHYATADCADLTQAVCQEQRFRWFCARLEERGLRIPLRHMDNSAGLMNFQSPYELVRSGIVTYGLYPSSEVSPDKLPIRPVLNWKSRISNLQTLPAGRAIGYGGTFVTTAPTRVATVPIGYADGYRWSLSGNFHVLIRGCFAPILGRVCMDQMMVDVTNITDVEFGDTVVLVGRDRDKAITVEEISAAAGTFPYEFVCGISRRVPRVYLRGGQPDHTVRYLIPKNKENP
jgi:alanine racemase